MALALATVEETRDAWAKHGRDVQPVIKVSRRLTWIKWVTENPFKKFKPFLTQWAKEARAIRRKRAR
jgi:hypothetical protein